MPQYLEKAKMHLGKTVSVSVVMAMFSVFGNGAWAALQLPTTDASDGVFAPTANCTIDLSLASTAIWSAPSAGNGVYDPDQWAVVFKFASVNIPSGVTVTFKNHPSYAPVIWLVQGDVTISGVISLNGEGEHDGLPYRMTEPGPGGFRGGRGGYAGVPPSGGAGPGGGQVSSEWGGSASYATAGGGPSAEFVGGLYGNEGIFPLLGGSGGASSYNYDGRAAGAGGGAILVVAASSVSVNGGVQARGGGIHGWGAGSGGSIRLVAERIRGGGVLNASGGNPGVGGQGRIRLEANQIEFAPTSAAPIASFGLPGTTPRIFRDDTTPFVRAVSIDGVAVPGDPNARLAYPFDAQVNNPKADAELLIEAKNVSTTATMTVRIVRIGSGDDNVQATFVSGNQAQSVWKATVDLRGGISTFQIHATF